MKIRYFALLPLATLIGAPKPLVPPGRAARSDLEQRFLSVPYWQRAAWAESRYNAIGEPDDVTERYSKGQYLRLWRSVRSAAPPLVKYRVEGHDRESRRLDLMLNRLSSRDLSGIREAQALLKGDPGDLMLTVELANAAGMRMSETNGTLDIPTPVALAYGEGAVRLAPNEPLARLARGADYFNRFLLMNLPKQHTRLKDRIPLARTALEDFRWFLARYKASAPKDDPYYAQPYVGVIEACIRILKKESGLP